MWSWRIFSGALSDRSPSAQAWMCVSLANPCARCTHPDYQKTLSRLSPTPPTFASSRPHVLRGAGAEAWVTDRRGRSQAKFSKS